MNAIIDFFTSILEILISLVKMVATSITSILWLVTNLPQMLNGVTAGFAYAPDFIVPFISASVGILVVMMIIRLMF